MYRLPFFITRLPEGTVISDEKGERINLLRRLRKVGREGRTLYQAQVKVGRDKPVDGRLVAAKIDPVKAAERKRRLRKNCKETGKPATSAQLTMCEWVVVFTNVEADMMDADSVAQLYRARWMVEIFFKGIKSGQQLGKWSRHLTNENTIQCLACAQMIIAVLSLNLWRVMGRMLAERGRDTASGELHGSGQKESSGLRTVGPLNAMQSLVGLLEKVFSGVLKGRPIGDEIARLARYAALARRIRHEPVNLARMGLKRAFNFRYHRGSGSAIRAFHPSVCFTL